MFRCSIFLIAALLRVITLNGQIVQVPIGTGCTVVVAGVGGSVALNQVGNGGIVLMTDNFDVPGAGGTFNWLSGTVTSWTLYGDISLQTDLNQAPPVPGANPPNQTAGPVTSVNIQSYNKNLRTAELGTPAVGRSKGRVTVVYKGTCDPTMSFDILKQWTTNAPAITGPNCWPLANQPVTFSVDPLISDNPSDAIGFDTYYWKLTNVGGMDLFASPGNAVTIAPDRSAVTVNMSDPAFTTWFTGNTFTIQCCYGRGNPWDGGSNPLSLTRLVAGNNCVSKVLAMPLAPVFNGMPTCVNAITPLLPIAVSMTNFNSAYAYSWSRTNPNWAFTPNGTGGFTITSINGADPCTFILTCTPLQANVGCAATFTYTINRSYNFSAAALGSPFCTIAGTNVLTVSLPTNAQGNQTCWGTLPAGWSAANSGPANVVFTIPTAAAGSTNTINLFSCGACAATTLPIVINVRPATPGPVAGPTCVTAGTSAGYSVPQTGTFAWTLPAGWSAPPATSTISVTAGNAGTVQVTLAGQTGCPSLPAALAVNINPVVTIPCFNSVGVQTTGASFSCNPGNASSAWTFPAGLTATTTATGNPVSITTVTSPTAGTYGCSVTTNGCTTNFNVVISASTYSATVNEIDPAVSVLQATFNPTTWYQLYDCSTGLPVPPGTWSLGTAGFVASLIAAGPGSFAFNCDPAPQGGCIQRTNCVTTVHKSMQLDGVEAASGVTILERDMVISPNPNSGQFQVSVTHDLERGTATLFDAQGRRVNKPSRLAPGPNTLEFGDLKPGVYTLRTEIDGVDAAHRVVIEAR